MQDFPDVDAYIAAADRWPDEIAALRPLLLDSGLDEHIKWGKPCYALGEANVVIVQEAAGTTGQRPGALGRLRRAHARASAGVQPARLRGEAGQHPGAPRRRGRSADPRRQGPSRPLIRTGCRVRGAGSVRRGGCTCRSGSLAVAADLRGRRVGRPAPSAGPPELAAEVGVSPYHLHRRFRAATGWTAHAYRDHLRLREGLARVLDGEPDLSALAFDLGYASHSHFTTRFRRAFGATPSQVRRDGGVTTRR